MKAPYEAMLHELLHAKIRSGDDLDILAGQR